MQKHGAMLTVACVLLLFTFNCTFPLQRDTSTPNKTYYTNQTIQCPSAQYHDFFPDKRNNMETDLQNVIKQINNTIQNESDAYLGLKKNLLNEDDLRHYEQLVIMKKYPYLDIKELEMKYSPTSNKDSRQSVKFHSRVNIVPEPSICEPVEDMINVEISNRGLSGFSIPNQLVKHLTMADNKLKVDLSSKTQNKENTVRKSSDRNILQKLKDDISMFIDKKKRY